MKITKLAQCWLTRTTKPFQFTKDSDQRLAFQDLQELGLYVHLPFCRSLCSFCPYCKTIYTKELAMRYVQALIQEIHLCAAGQLEKKLVTSLYIGGGTPCLCIDELPKILQAIHEHFEIQDGIGIELHPSDVTIEKLTALQAMGITKISIGMQSFDAGCLAALGRKPFDHAGLLQLLSQVSFETISVDFIFAIPGQTFDSLKQDLDTAFASSVNHVALYPLIPFSFQPMGERMKAKEKQRLLYQILSYAKAKGYHRTSIWTFAKQQQHYSSMTRTTYLGFGCSAATLLQDQFKINTFDVEEYCAKLQANQLPTSLTCRFTRHQRMIYYLFWDAYSTIIDPVRFHAFFHTSLKRHYGFELTIARLFGLFKKQDGCYHLTDRGTYYYHYFEGYYTYAYIDEMWNTLRKESFPQEMSF